MTITIRLAQPADAAAIAAVQVASWRAACKGIIADDDLAQLSAADREPVWQRELDHADPDRCTCVAVNAAGQLVGFAAGQPERAEGVPTLGEVRAIYVLPGCWRNGIGRGLMQATAGCLYDRGYTDLLVRVLKGSGAEAFCRALGGSRVREGEIPIGNRTYTEIALHWPGVSGLLRPTE